MPDVFNKAKRSEVMSRIRGRGNKDTELALAKLFRRHKITGWRRQKVLTVRSSRRKEAHSENPRSSFQQPTSVRASSRRLLRVKADFVFRQARLAVFVDGCFWHSCPKHATKPKNNRAFWRRKLTANQRRDRIVNRTLRAQGWRVLRIWEHALAKIKTISTPQPKPSPPAPLHYPGTPHPAAPPSPHPMRRRKSDGRGWRRPLPERGGEGAEARLMRRIQRALA
jgi:DNA mismatch endonuclease (patch repair protein)